VNRTEQLFARLDTDTGFAVATAKDLFLSSQQVRNLVQLARYLRSLPADYGKFGMSDYFVKRSAGDWSPTGAATGLQECGTSACAAGHGPVAGIVPRPNEGWAQYTGRAFGAVFSAYVDWLFHPGWDWEDNTPRGAAARIAYALANPDPIRNADFKLLKPHVYAEYVA
jgi:hypothetical protein